MKTWLFILCVTTIGFAQETPSFIEIGGVYRIQGDLSLNAALEDQDFEIEVTAISNNWIKARIDTLSGEVWLNLDHMRLIVDIRDVDWLAREASSDQVTFCLRELATAQEVYLIDNDTYTTHQILFESGVTISACDGVELTTYSNPEIEDVYFVGGRLGEVAFYVTPSSGIIPASLSQNHSSTVRSCLKELATLQEVHYIDFGTYGSLFSLRREYGNVDVCDDVALTSKTVDESEYEIIGRIADSAYKVTPFVGIESLSD